MSTTDSVPAWTEALAARQASDAEVGELIPLYAALAEWELQELEPGCLAAAFGDEAAEFVVLLWFGDYSPGAITVQYVLAEELTDDASELMAIANDWNRVGRLLTAVVEVGEEDDVVLGLRATIPVVPEAVAEHVFSSLDLAMMEFQVFSDWLADPTVADED